MVEGRKSLGTRLSNACNLTASDAVSGYVPELTFGVATPTALCQLGVVSDNLLSLVVSVVGSYILIVVDSIGVCCLGGAWRPP